MLQDDRMPCVQQAADGPHAGARLESHRDRGLPGRHLQGLPAVYSSLEETAWPAAGDRCRASTPMTWPDAKEFLPKRISSEFENESRSAQLSRIQVPFGCQ